MVQIICCVIICFGMAMIAAGLKEGLANITVNITVPKKLTVEKTLAHRPGEHKYEIK